MFVRTGGMYNTYTCCCCCCSRWVSETQHIPHRTLCLHIPYSIHHHGRTCNIRMYIYFFRDFHSVFTYLPFYSGAKYIYVYEYTRYTCVCDTFFFFCCSLHIYNSFLPAPTFSVRSSQSRPRRTKKKSTRGKSVFHFCYMYTPHTHTHTSIQTPNAHSII